jgi:hypothetical protein
VFQWFRLRILGLFAWDHLFLLHGLVRLGLRFLLRDGFLWIAVLWIAIFLIRHFVSPLLVLLLLVKLSRTQRALVAPPISLPDHLFDLPDLSFNFAGIVFGRAFGLQVGILRELAGLLLDFAFHLMECAFDLILCARLHLLSPYRCILADSESGTRQLAPRYV